MPSQFKFRQTERFHHLAKTREPILDSLDPDMFTVERLKFEKNLARSRAKLAKEYYTIYELEQRKNQRTPLPLDIILGVMNLDVEKAEELLQEALKYQQQQDDKFVEYQLRLQGSRGIAGFFRRRKFYQKLEAQHSLEALNFHLAELSKFDRSLYQQNLIISESMGFIEHAMFWSVLVDDDEKPETLDASLKGYKRYIISAWATSILWCAFCLLFILTWLFRIDNADSESYSIVSWLKSFGVSSIFDFLVFTPISILFKGVIVPILVTLLLRTRISKSFNYHAA